MGDRVCRRLVVCAGFLVPLTVVLPAAMFARGEEPVVVSINPTERGEEISPLIYGQFIEHLGRCIYGGIWAEMLEDRKFYEPVGADASPWKVIGDGGGVSMATDAPFVGKHTPEITLPGDGTVCGIEQRGLGLVAGKEYDGRVWLAGDASAAPVSISLVWGDEADERSTISVDSLSSEYRKVPLRFTSGANTEDGRLVITSRGSGAFRIGTVSLMPADNVAGMRRDTLTLLRELDAPIYRWPGGNFVSGYDWRDGIGDPDRRPPRKNPAWKGIEHNDFGIDEYMRFCRLLRTEPYIVVNSGLGDVSLALAELEYVNGPADSEWGRKRAENGHPEPYGVVYWGIGNEMYGNWQLGHMPLEDYVEKHNAFVEAMRQQDASIRVIGVGNVGRWTEGMLRHCADHMDLISEHFYVQYRENVVEHVAQAANRVRAIAAAHRRYRDEILGGRAIPVALDEWNYWYGPHLYGELGTRYYLRDGLGVAAALNEFARNTDVYAMANYAQTVNVIGAIKTSKTVAAFETTGLMLKLFRRHFGKIPVKTSVDGPLDAQGALSADGKQLTLSIVNPTDTAVAVTIDIGKKRPSGKAVAWEVSGEGPQAYNEPGKLLNVDIVEKSVVLQQGCCRVSPWSATILAIPLE
ncbi:hypothetical protein JCM19992_23420 [Thermostilla marina]